MEVLFMSKFEAFKLRTTLLKIWAVKNTVVFFELFLFIGIILVLTGQLPESTPIVGELSLTIKEVFTNQYSNDFFLNIIGTVLSLLVTIGMLSTNTKNIVLSDIKSKKLKKSLVKAGLYFNQDGRLVKRLEEAMNMDLTGNGKIGDKDVSVEDLPREGFLPKLKQAGEELGTIMTVKIETKEDAQEAAKEANLEKTQEALTAVQQAALQDMEDIMVREVNKKVEAKVKQPGLASKVSKLVIDGVKTGAKSTGNFFIGIGKGFSKLFSKIGSMFKKKEKVEKVKKVKNVQPTIQIQPVAVEQKPLTRREMLEKLQQESKNKAR
jgi:hypothetical protein